MALRRERHRHRRVVGAVEEALERQRPLAERDLRDAGAAAAGGAAITTPLAPTATCCLATAGITWLICTAAASSWPNIPFRWATEAPPATRA